jgi:hypothetical protein
VTGDIFGGFLRVPICRIGMNWNFIPDTDTDLAEPLEIVDEIKRGKKDQLLQTYILLITAHPFNGGSYAIGRYRMRDEYGEKKET